MAVTPVPIVRTTLPNATAVAYASPTNTKTIVKRAVFTNYTGASHTLDVTVTPSGGSAIVLIKGMTLTAGQAYVANELGNLVLSAGDAINAWSDAATSVSMIASGFTV